MPSPLPLSFVADTNIIAATFSMAITLHVAVTITIDVVTTLAIATTIQPPLPPYNHQFIIATTTTFTENINDFLCELTK